MSAPHGTDDETGGGRVRIGRVGTDHTDLRISQPGGDSVTRRVDALPDVLRARRTRKGLDRVMWQRLDLGHGHTHADVRGIRHRRPSSMPVGLPTALGLLLDGVPTLLAGDATAVGVPS